MNDNTLARFGSYYHEFLRANPTAADDFRLAIEELLNDAGVTYDRVSTRVKTWPSLKSKARKRQDDGTLLYPDPFRDIHDIIGVRVMVFHSTEIPSAITVLKDSFTVRKSVDKAAETRISGGFGYGSHHMVLEVDETHEDLGAYAGMEFEVQIRTVLQHAWAEFEHDIRYKSTGDSGRLDPEVDRMFTLAAGLIELADQQFDQIAALKVSSRLDDEQIDLSPETLPGVLAVLLGNRFPRSRSENYRWLAELLSAHGITTVEQLRNLLQEPDIEVLGKAMKYRFRPGQIRLIDDLLLRRFGQAHIDATHDSGSAARSANRRVRLQRRLEQMRQAHII